jgi:hypothetical protein
MQFIETQLDSAFDWLCRQRRNYPANADVWHLRFHWSRERNHLLELIRNRRYQFSPWQMVQKADGEVIHLWSARDALVLKALSNMLTEVLPISPACTHVKHYDGLKSTERKARRPLPHSNVFQPVSVRSISGRVWEVKVGLTRTNNLAFDMCCCYTRNKEILETRKSLEHLATIGKAL